MWNPIKMKSEVNVNFSENVFFWVHAGINGLQLQVSWWKTHSFQLNFQSRVHQYQFKQFRNKVYTNVCVIYQEAIMWILPHNDNNIITKRRGDCKELQVRYIVVLWGRGLHMLWQRYEQREVREMSLVISEKWVNRKNKNNFCIFKY